MDFKTTTSPFRTFFIEFFFFAVIAFFFTTLGTDVPSQLRARYALTTVFFIFFLIIIPKPIFKVPAGRVSLILLWLFVIYEIARAVYGGLGMKLLWGGNYEPHFDRFYVAPIRWVFFLGLYMMAYIYFHSRNSVKRLLQLTGWVGFGLAVAAIPPLMQKGIPLYSKGLIEGYGYFPGSLYFHPLIEKYVLGRSSHVNYTGDLVAMGFFAAFGLTLYGFQLFKERIFEYRQRHMHSTPWDATSYFLLPLTVAFVCGGAVLLFNSRGTILCFAIVFVLFLLFMLIRFHSQLEVAFTTGIVVVILSLTFWAGNYQQAWKELQTLSEEDREGSSWQTNVDGASRAMRMFSNYPILGIGTNGYKDLSEQYAGVEKKRFDIARYHAMCHYVQMLAEEGYGALLYFAFLIAFLGEVLIRLWRTQSRFQYIAAVTLFLMSFMLLLHGGFNHLLERVTVSALLHIFMGACMSALRQDFE